MLITNIAQIVGTSEQKEVQPLRGDQLSHLPVLNNAWLSIKDGLIHDFGPMDTVPQGHEEQYDALGGSLFPAWVDSHTHLVFAASRENEFTDRIQGLSYQEIAAKGGGILNSARRLREMSEDELFQLAKRRLLQVQKAGTGAIEIKSGYGLSYEGELKMLRVIKRLKAASSMAIKSTFLGAHALPAEYKDDRGAYLNLLMDRLIPQIAEEGLADYVDAFCEQNYFTPDETRAILKCGAAHGLRGKIHVNQFNALGGIKVAVEEDALSVDHLEILPTHEIDSLSRSNTIGTMLPTAPFFLNDPYPPAREMIDSGVAVALATDFNPGSSPSYQMSFVVSLACIKLKMTPEEAIRAATIQGAFALELQHSHGSITRGKVASFFISHPIPSLAYLPYSFGENCIRDVFLSGERII